MVILYSFINVHEIERIGIMAEGKFEIKDFLKRAVATGASDEHLLIGQQPFIRKNGVMKRIVGPTVTLTTIANILLEIAPFQVQQELSNSKDVDFIYEIPGVSRFRVNYSRRLGGPSLVFRNIPYSIPSVEKLGLPPVLNTFAKYQNGLVIVVGPTGSGKSTSLAAVINEININEPKNIITLEEPIEYIYECKKSMVSQRQIGVDTETFANGVKYALRQDPDVIFVGEIRDMETMDAALKAAETGHLVFATLHTNDAVQTINRIINMFDETHRALARKRVAETLRATVAQKLVYSAQHDKRFPVCEVMIVTSTIKDYILKADTEEIYKLIASNQSEGMCSLNQSLAALVGQGLISADEAMANSNDVNELSKILRGVY